jgi:hypothetical protein
MEEADMKIVWKQALGSVALSAMAISLIGTDGAAARNKSSKMEPPPPAAEKVETGQILIRDRPNRPSVEKGIKDPGHKISEITAEAAPPPVDDGATPPSAEYELKGGGQHLEKPPRDNPSIERRAHNGPGGTPPSSAAKGGKTGWIFPTVGALTAATLVAVVASGNDDDNPTSP